MDYASNVVKLFKLSSSEPRLPIAWASPIPMYQTVSALKIKKKKKTVSAFKEIEHLALASNSQTKIQANPSN